MRRTGQETLTGESPLNQSRETSSGSRERWRSRSPRQDTTVRGGDEAATRGGARRTCYYFQYGRCLYGDRCYYVHETVSQARPLTSLTSSRSAVPTPLPARIISPEKKGATTEARTSGSARASANSSEHANFAENYHSSVSRSACSSTLRSPSRRIILRDYPSPPDRVSSAVSSAWQHRSSPNRKERSPRYSNIRSSRELSGGSGTGGPPAPALSPLRFHQSRSPSNQRSRSRPLSWSRSRSRSRPQSWSRSRSRSRPQSWSRSRSRSRAFSPSSRLPPSRQLLQTEQGSRSRRRSHSRSRSTLHSHSSRRYGTSSTPRSPSGQRSRSRLPSDSHSPRRSHSPRPRHRQPAAKEPTRPEQQQQQAQRPAGRTVARARPRGPGTGRFVGQREHTYSPVKETSICPVCHKEFLDRTEFRLHRARPVCRDKALERSLPQDPDVAPVEVPLTTGSSPEYLINSGDEAATHSPSPSPPRRFRRVSSFVILERDRTPLPPALSRGHPVLRRCQPLADTEEGSPASQNSVILITRAEGDDDDDDLDDIAVSDDEEGPAEIDRRAFEVTLTSDVVPVERLRLTSNETTVPISGASPPRLAPDSSEKSPIGKPSHQLFKLRPLRSLLAPGILPLTPDPPASPLESPAGTQEPGESPPYKPSGLGSVLPVVATTNLQEKEWLRGGDRPVCFTEAPASPEESCISPQRPLANRQHHSGPGSDVQDFEEVQNIVSPAHIPSLIPDTSFDVHVCDGPQPTRTRYVRTEYVSLQEAGVRLPSSPLEDLLRQTPESSAGPAAVAGNQVPVTSSLVTAPSSTMIVRDAVSPLSQSAKTSQPSAIGAAAAQAIPTVWVASSQPSAIRAAAAQPSPTVRVASSQASSRPHPIVGDTSCQLSSAAKGVATQLSTAVCASVSQVLDTPPPLIRSRQEKESDQMELLLDKKKRFSLIKPRASPSNEALSLVTSRMGLHQRKASNTSSPSAQRHENKLEAHRKTIAVPVSAAIAGPKSPDVSSKVVRSAAEMSKCDGQKRKKETKLSTKKSSQEANNETERRDTERKDKRSDKSETRSVEQRKKEKDDKISRNERSKDGERKELDKNHEKKMEREKSDKEKSRRDKEKKAKKAKNGDKDAKKIFVKEGRKLDEGRSKSRPECEQVDAVKPGVMVDSTATPPSVAISAAPTAAPAAAPTSTPLAASALAAAPFLQSKLDAVATRAPDSSTAGPGAVATLGIDEDFEDSTKAEAEDQPAPVAARLPSSTVIRAENAPIVHDTAMGSSAPIGGTESSSISRPDLMASEQFLASAPRLLVAAVPPQVAALSSDQSPAAVGSDLHPIVPAEPLTARSLEDFRTREVGEEREGSIASISSIERSPSYPNSLQDEEDSGCSEWGDIVEGIEPGEDVSRTAQRIRKVLTQPIEEEFVLNKDLGDLITICPYCIQPFPAYSDRRVDVTDFTLIVYCGDCNKRTRIRSSRQRHAYKNLLLS